MGYGIYPYSQVKGVFTGQSGIRYIFLKDGSLLEEDLNGNISKVDLSLKRNTERIKADIGIGHTDVVRDEKQPLIERKKECKKQIISKQLLDKRRKKLKFKAVNIFISPAKAVRYDLQDTTLDLIICSDSTFPEAIGRNNVLLLHFLDIENDKSPLAFQPKHAREIIHFLSRDGANQDLFVCCDGGESRSPAIAAAINLAIGKPDMPIWESRDYHPNQLVFQRLCWALGVQLQPADIIERLEANKRSAAT